MACVEPTIVASSPIARCRKPPILAFAYISPARSSKRRLSAIAATPSPPTPRPRGGQAPACLGLRVHPAGALLETADERHRRQPLTRHVRLRESGSRGEV